MTFFGGISTQRTLPFGDRRDVLSEVRWRLNKIGAGGGYLATPAHAIPANAKPENILALIEALDRQ